MLEPARSIRILAAAVLGAVCASPAFARADAPLPLAPSLSSFALRTDAGTERRSVILHLAPTPRTEPRTLLARAARHYLMVTELQTAIASQAELRAALDTEMLTGEVEGYTGYWITNCIVASVSSSALRRLAARDDVEWIEPNFQPHLIAPVDAPDAPIEAFAAGAVPPGVAGIQADRVWRELGITGRGRVVASLDTGVEGEHRALRAHWRGIEPGVAVRAAWLDVIDGTQQPIDPDGHGTRVAGIVAGVDPVRRDTIGVAPGATWIAARILDETLDAEFDNRVLAAYQWLVDPDGDPTTVDDVPDAVVNSWSIEVAGRYEQCDARFWSAIDNAEAAGIVTLWPAGNAGPRNLTIVPPADRATTATNSFAVSAVDATHFLWPFPVPDYSSRGPTGCEAPMDAGMKPELAAPGSNIYTSARGGGFASNQSSTTFAAAHVAGVVALMREANPDLDVESIKRILLDTAVGQGARFEDEEEGRGVVRAYDAVVRATQGLAHVAGVVRNASNGGSGIAGALVQVLEPPRVFRTGAGGGYRGSLPTGRYRLAATHASFASDTLSLSLGLESTADSAAILDFQLRDVVAPVIELEEAPHLSLPSGANSLIRARARDESSVTGATLHTRARGEIWRESPLAIAGDSVAGGFPEFSPGSVVDYVLRVHDSAGNAASYPPLGSTRLRATRVGYRFDGGDGAEAAPGWQFGAPDDRATGGQWELAVPVASSAGSLPLAPGADHSADGSACFVTRNGAPGQSAGDTDIDDGCVSLVSPELDLAGADGAFLRFWIWCTAFSPLVDDSLFVEASADSGRTWSSLLRLPATHAGWIEEVLAVDSTLVEAGHLRVRFRACDLGRPGLVEAAVDDVSLETFTSRLPDPPDPPSSTRTPTLQQNQPNPFVLLAGGDTRIRFQLTRPERVELDLFDVAGRHVRRLLEEPAEAGAREAIWDGLDDHGRSVPAGAYVYRLRAGSFVQSRRLVLLR